MTGPFSRIQALPDGQVRRLAVLFAGGLAAVLAILFYSSTWRTGDDGRYYALGMSIAQGAGLVQSANPELPPETLTPPLYPALIAAIIRITDNPVVWVKRLGNVLFVCSAMLMVLLLAGRGRVSPAVILGACMGMFAVGFVSFASFVMADMLFILLAFSSLWGAGWLNKDQGRGAFLLGGCAGLACMTRSAGLALAAAVCWHALARREWRNLLGICLGLGLVMAPWYIWKIFVVTEGPGYLDFAEIWAQTHYGKSLQAHFLGILALEIVRDLPRFMLEVIPSHFFYHAEKIAFTPGFWTWAGRLVGVGASAGFLLRIRQWNATDYFFAFTLLLIAIIPGPVYDRSYFYPVLPIAAFYFFGAVAWLAERFPRIGIGRKGVQAVWLVALGLFGVSLLVDFAAGAVHFIKEQPRRPFGPWAPERFRAFETAYDDAWAGVSEAATWIKENTPTNALLLSRKPDHLLVMSGRKGWRYDIPREVGRQTIMESVEKFAPEQMVLLLEDAFPTGSAVWTYGNNREAVLNATVRKVPEKWQMIHATEDPVTRVWAYTGDE